jgi:hypothetical protein
VEHLWYEAGNEHSQTDPWGRVTVQASCDGVFRLDHHGRSGHRAWTARPDEVFLRRLESALLVAGFPVAPAIMPLCGERMRHLRVTGAPSGEVLLPWYDALTLPGYGEAFSSLDGLVVRVTGLEIPVPPPLPGAGDVQQVVLGDTP